MTNTRITDPEILERRYVGSGFDVRVCAYVCAYASWFLAPHVDGCAHTRLSGELNTHVLLNASGRGHVIIFCTGARDPLKLSCRHYTTLHYPEFVCLPQACTDDHSSRQSRHRCSCTSFTNNTLMCWLFVVVPRYPVILNSFGLRRGSGGGGARPGGDGVARSMTFRKPLTVSVLSERRAFRPWGLAGGLPAERGVSKKNKREGAIIARHPIPHLLHPCHASRRPPVPSL